MRLHASCLTLALTSLTLGALGGCDRGRDETRPIHVVVHAAPGAELACGDAGAVGTTTITGAELGTAADERERGDEGAPADAGPRVEPSERYGIIAAPDRARNLGMEPTGGAAAAPGGGPTEAPSPSPAPAPRRDEGPTGDHPSAADPIPWSGTR